MQFIDEVTVEVTAGRGGDGCVSFLRERNKPRGGPDGGNGGRGGNIYLIVQGGLNTLVDYRYKRFIRAKNGKQGEGSQKTGHAGEDIYLPVPIGLKVTDAESGLLLGELMTEQSQLCIAMGGKAGRGNMSFVSSTNRTPYQHTKGTLGECKKLYMELQILADVGLVGMPNAGKSSLIRKLSAATPRVADYPFTTMVPQLGMLRKYGKEVVLADIPGLIAGSAEGRGLGNRFLRHINRTSLLWHIVDLAPLESSPLAHFRIIERELQLSSYSQLATRPVWLILNKIDMLEKPDRAKIVKAWTDETKGQIPVYCISALSGDGCEQLGNDALKWVNEHRPVPQKTDAAADNATDIE